MGEVLRTRRTHVPCTCMRTYVHTSQREIVGEVLLTTRYFYSSASICPDRRDGSESDSDYELDPSIPIDHATEPMAPIPEPDAWGSLGAPRR